MSSKNDIDVAVLCSGLDNVRRGYETHSRMLFTKLVAEDVFKSCRLFKGSGKSEKNETVIPRPSRRGLIVTILKRIRGTNLYWEYFFFALGFVIYSVMTRTKFDVLVTIEPEVCKWVDRFRKLIGTPRIIYTHGVWRDPAAYVNGADVVHEVNVENYERSVAFSKDNKVRAQIELIPHFCDYEVERMDKQQCREKLGLKTKHVLLSVGAIDRNHKRMDYLVEEMTGLSEDWSLVLCGPILEPDIIDRAKEVLGDRFHHLLVPRDEIRYVYGCADVFVLAATTEGFGIVLLEAMASGLPIVVHATEQFSWLFGGDNCCIDMAQKGELVRFLKARTAEDNWFSRIGEQNAEKYETEYTWKVVRERYLKLIETAYQRGAKK